MSRRLLLLAIPVGILAAFVFLWELPRDRASREREAEAAVLFPIADAVVDTVRLARPEGDILFARPDGTWRLRAPKDEPVEPSTVENLLRRLADARRERVVMALAVDQDLDPYGLGGPADGTVRVDVVDSLGTRHSLWVGKRTPSRQNTYVRRVGSDEVELAGPELSQIAGLTHHGFRRRALFATADSLVVEWTVERGGDRWTARRDDAGLWWWDRDPPVRLQRHRLAGFVYDLARATVRQYVRDDVPDREWPAYGLGQPRAILSWADATGAAGRVAFGNEDDEGLMFARRNGEDTLLRIPIQLVEHALVDPEDLVDTNPIPRNFRRLQSFTLRWEDGSTLGALKQGADWITLLPADSRVDDEDLTVPLRNVLYGLERFSTQGEMLLAASSATEDVLDRIPVRGELNWEDGTLGFLIGWRGNGEDHWFHLEGEPRLHRISRDLFLRLQGYLQVAGLLAP